MKILQIIPSPKPLWAVFKDNEQLIFDECPVVALVEHREGHRQEPYTYVIGLSLDDGGYEDPSICSNFVCYTHDKEKEFEKLKH